MSRVESSLTLLPPCAVLCVVAPVFASVRSEFAAFGILSVAAVGLAWLIVAIITVAKTLAVAQSGVDSGTE
jgi:uncharacterized membrane protein